MRADVAIKDGRFAKIGHVEGRGRREIDAANDYVSPRWIDTMDQSGEVLLKNGLAENKLRQGVTTAIAGEGGTPVPSAQIADYFSRLETQGISLNFGTYYGSGQARVEVMGDVAGKPTTAQMEKMKAHVAEAMRAGSGSGSWWAIWWGPRSPWRRPTWWDSCAISWIWTARCFSAAIGRYTFSTRME